MLAVPFEKNCTLEPSESAAVTPFSETIGSVNARLDSADTTILPCGCVSAAGILSPMSCRRLTAYPDQPTATTDAASAYSSSSSAPMTQAPNSPTVVYEYVYAEPDT